VLLGTELINHTITPHAGVKKPIFGSLSAKRPVTGTEEVKDQTLIIKISRLASLPYLPTSHRYLPQLTYLTSLLTTTYRSLQSAHVLAIPGSELTTWVLYLTSLWQLSIILNLLRRWLKLRKKLYHRKLTSSRDSIVMKLSVLYEYCFEDMPLLTNISSIILFSSSSLLLFSSSCCKQLLNTG